MMRLGVFLLIALSLTVASLVDDARAESVQAEIATPPITEFHPVTTDIYRGARPGLEGLKALAQMGIKTDLNLDNDETANSEEESSAAALHLRYIARPMSGFFAPSDAEVDEILSILADKTHYPLFVHCKHGQDRTGLIVGLFRVLNQAWAPHDAYNEMIQYNFHPMLFPLDNYFRERTGLGLNILIIPGLPLPSGPQLPDNPVGPVNLR